MATDVLGGGAPAVGARGVVFSKGLPHSAETQNLWVAFAGIREL
jgi:hypothetical protein